MNAVDFVEGIRVVVCKAAARGIVEVMEKPPGRCPAKDLMALSHWFSALHQSDREMVARVASFASDQTAYNFLLVLDGHLTVERSRAKGVLRLIYEKESFQIILNDSNCESLSSLFKAQ